MALNASKVQYDNKNSNKKKQPTLEPGTYPGRFVGLIDLGLQPQRPYDGKPRPPSHQIQLTYELVDVFMLDEDDKELEDKPRWISETINFNALTADLATSTKRYKAFDPELACEGDFTRVLGTPVNITIAVDQDKKDKEKFYENVSSVTPMRQRDIDKCPPLKNDVRVFDLDSPDMKVFEQLPKWIQDKLTSNLNFNGSALEAALAGKAPEEKKEPKSKQPAAPVEEDGDDDIPF